MSNVECIKVIAGMICGIIIVYFHTKLGMNIGKELEELEKNVDIIKKDEN